MKIGAELVIIFLSISIVPLTTLGTIISLRMEQRITEQTLWHMEALASVQEQEVRTIVSNKIDSLASFTSRPQLTTEIDNYIANRTTLSKYIVDVHLSIAKSNNPSFKEIYLLDPEGIVVASTNESEIGASFSNSTFFVDGKEANTLSNFFFDHNQQPRFWLSGPVTSGNRLIGVAAVSSDVEDFSSINTAYARFSETAETYLGQREDDGDVAIITPLRFSEDELLTVSASRDASTAPIVQALEGTEATLTNSRDYRNEPVLAATRYIDDVDMGLVVKMDRAEALAPLYDMVFLLFGVGVVISTMVVVISFLLGQSITQPITKLIEKTAEISKGNLGSKIDNVTGNDEVKELASHFERMRVEIKSVHDNLQARVHEKTRELEFTNAELKEKNQSLEHANKILQQQKELLQYANNVLQEQKKALQEIDKMKAEFSAMVTHELKTPLVPIVGYTSLFLNDRLGELTEGQKQKIEVIHRNAQRLTKLVQDILDMRKLELGTMTMNMQQVSCLEMIKSAVDVVRHKADSKHVNVSYSVREGKQLVVNCDEHRIIQVLVNLLDNALNFVQDHNGRIEVIATSSDSQVTISVVDNGKGIPREKQAKLFTKFYQADTSLTRRTSGAGLGLAISKSIIEAHSGRIWFQNGKEKGSIFSFSLPK